jgi:crotonobetainyl-CoA:carnitine CoA-transferase CaiB-like acyl-CoA transferase
MDDTRPFHGLTCVRVGTSRAGDFLCDLLADQGMQVTEAPAPGDAVAGQVAAADVLIDDVPGGPGWFAPRGSNAVLLHLVGAPPNPFGLDETDLDDAPVHALLGLDAMGGDPQRAEPLPVASYYAALLSAVYVAAGLLVADRRGSEITVSLLGAAATVLSREELRLGDERLTDVALLPHLPNVAIYECADGRYVQPHGLYDHFVKIMLEVAGHPEWIPDAVRALHQLPDRAAAEMWRARLRELFLTRPAREWEDAMAAAGGALTMLRTPGEWISEQHARDAQVVLAVTPEGDGRLGPAIRVDPSGASSQRREDGWPTLTGDETGLPLSGVRVLDLCIVLAGPSCGRVLAELGADVLKVDAPGRFISPFPWFDVNRCKRSTVVDLTNPDSYGLVGDLVAGADVVLQNFRSGKSDKLGLGPQALLRRAPGTVVCALNLFDFGGAWQNRPGWEHNAQAGTGLQWARARSGLPRQVPFAVDDYGTGLAAAFGVVSALFARRQTGQGSLVRGSLARTASWLRSVRAPGTGVRLLPSAMPEPDRPGLPNLGMRDRRLRDWLVEAGIMVRWNHPRIGLIEQVAPLPDAPGLQRRARWPAPEPGENDDILLAADDGDNAAVGPPKRFFASVLGVPPAP